MAGKVIAALVLVIALYVGFQVSNIYMPEQFESKGFFRVFYSIMKLISVSVKCLTFFGIGNEPQNIRALSKLGVILPTPPDHITIEEVFIEGIQTRVYSPVDPASRTRPLLVYYHGGGFFMGELATQDMFLLELVKKLDIRVISVGYRLAPEYPFPIPTEDCYQVTRHIFQNAAKFHADPSRFLVAGDSAGGTVVAAITQRLRKEKLPEPKIQILVYPLMQFADPHLPSYLKYVPTGITGAVSIGLEKLTPWYLGILNQTGEIQSVFDSREHFALIEDPAQHRHVADCLDTSIIDSKFKPDLSYYESSKKFAKFPDKLSPNSVLKSNPQLREMFKKVFSPEVSPLFARDGELVGLPKAYFMLLEWDFLKDESFLYSYRLEKAGVEVHRAFYENAYHGIASTLDIFTIAKKMHDDLVEYLKSNL